MSYNFKEIEAKWQRIWAERQTFRSYNDSEKEKFYVLDMFPYPSGAGLHVGHPLGYIASDIYARYKRHKGYNVLHPMGYDAFGLPAEQYAIETGQHPAITTRANISRYREQLDRLGFSFDWSREVRTSDPAYYKWTQWIFIQLFNVWYNRESDKAETIQSLIEHFKKEGNSNVHAACDEDTPAVSAGQWNAMSWKDQQKFLLKYRLTYLADSEVNWCPALGTVLANDEVINGVSERGGHPVVRKKMTQWSMRITAYAQRLLQGLENIDWPQPLKDAQTNWIGRSVGAEVRFLLEGSGEDIRVFTTRPDTIFGVSFMTLAPEHDLVHKITTPEQREAVKAYVDATALRSERDRLADNDRVTGVFTGAYARHPFTGKSLPVWIGDFVLAGYGTGAVMSVPCGDQRDYDFAKHFHLPVPNIFEGVDISGEAFSDKDGTLLANSDFLNGLGYKEATQRVIARLEETGDGRRTVNYRLRDAVFSRQRYWGEPFPVYYEEGVPRMLPTTHLPLVLPEVAKYLPTESGDPPLGNARIWAWDREQHKVVGNEFIDHKKIFPLELNTMPGWAGSSQYFNRYMDPHNEEVIFSSEAIAYWKQVDLYIGGIEHATGHLLYSRFWQKFMFDLGLVPVEEYASKVINQGMILGTSAFVFRRMVYEVVDEVAGTASYEPLSTDPYLVSRNKALQSESYFTDEVMEDMVLTKYPDLAAYKGRIRFNDLPLHVDVSLVHGGDELDISAFKKMKTEFRKAEFILENNKYIVGREVEKMSKSKYNVVSPDAICKDFGADSLRLYEMFLGPLEQSKPWNTAGITGVHSFLKKFWRLYHSGPVETFYVSEPPGELKDAADKDNLKTLHKTIKKVEEDIANFSFNTSVSTFMICVNELTSRNCRSREILEPLVILISPYAPHIAEELWEKLGHKESVSTAPFPNFKPEFLKETSKEYPISFNGKLRFTMELSLDLSTEEIEEAVMAHEKTREQLDGRRPKKVIVVPGKIVNIVG